MICYRALFKCVLYVILYTLLRFRFLRLSTCQLHCATSCYYQSTTCQVLWEFWKQKTLNAPLCRALSTWFTIFLSLSRERPALNDVLLILDGLVIWSDWRSDIFIISDKTIFLASLLSNYYTPFINLLSVIALTNWGRDCTICILLFQTNMIQACHTVTWYKRTDGLFFGIVFSISSTGWMIML